MDSPGWFDSGYVVPGDTDDGVSVYAGEKIYVNYDQTRTKYGDVIVEGRYNEVFYPTGYKTPQNYSIDINLDNTKTKYGDTIQDVGYKDAWYLAKINNGSYAYWVVRSDNVWRLESYKKPSCSIFANYNNTRSRVSGGQTFDKSWSNVNVTFLKTVYVNASGRQNQVPSTDVHVNSNTFYAIYNNGTTSKGSGTNYKEYIVS